MRRNRFKELYYNRPTKYIPAVIRMMKRHPYVKDDNSNFFLYIRNMLHLNWQVSFIR